jgi:hypothetical protein
VGDANQRERSSSRERSQLRVETGRDAQRVTDPGAARPQKIFAHDDIRG